MPYPVFDFFTEIISLIRFREYQFVIVEDDGRCYLQAQYLEPDVVTGRIELQKTRKWLLSKFMTRSEVVQTAFKCALTSMEHRTREYFLYDGERVYSPHYEVEALVELCRQKRFDERPDWYAEQPEDISK